MRKTINDRINKKHNTRSYYTKGQRPGEFSASVRNMGSSIFQECPLLGFFYFPGVSAIRLLFIFRECPQLGFFYFPRVSAIGLLLFSASVRTWASFIFRECLQLGLFYFLRVSANGLLLFSGSVRSWDFCIFVISAIGLLLLKPAEREERRAPPWGKICPQEMHGIKE